MAKKFFYDKVHNTKRTIINLIIIFSCVIGIIICFIIVSNFQGENRAKGELSLKNEVTIEVNEQFTNEIFFSKIENVDVNKIRVNYPNNYDITTPGEYNVSLTIDGKDYQTKLIVVDTIKPELVLKPATINKNGVYSPDSFVVSCTDNSTKKCEIAFYKNGVDEEGNPVNYANYKEPGTYAIKISASDESGNQSVLETTLVINDTTTDNPEIPPEIPPVDDPSKTCKYGNSSYDSANNILVLDVTSGGCAVSLDLYKNSEEINKIVETETTRLMKDIAKLNLEIPNDQTPQIDRNISAITNLSGDGIVGYELTMSYKFPLQNGELETIAEYKLDSTGKRIFTINKYNIPA